jgi:hypothetical protein
MSDTAPTDATTNDAPDNVADDLTTVRDLIVRAHPDIVPELVTGTSIAELTAAIEPARAAYQRIAEQTTRQAPPVPPSVPAGGAHQIIDPDRLPTAEKLRRGLAARS